MPQRLTPSAALGGLALLALATQASARPGTFYDVTVPSLVDGVDIDATVMEPTELEDGQSYPLIIHSHAFGGSKEADPDSSSPLGGLLARPLLDAGYGVLSFSQRGFGASGGTVQFMNPDFEGLDCVSILDWAEDNLEWLQYDDNDNLVVGANGGSYGGSYQYLCYAADPKNRLDTLVPEITWHSLETALSPGTVIKSSWYAPLAAAGLVGSQNRLDQTFVDEAVMGVVDNLNSDAFNDELHYHGLSYFCEDRGVSGDRLFAPGAVGEAGPVDVLMFQAYQDTLFPVNEAANNMKCLEQLGGDVRLMTYQSGNDAVFPSAYSALNPANAAGAVMSKNCGGVDYEELVMAWYEEKLQGVNGTVDAVLGGEKVCHSLSADEGVFTDEFPIGGVEYEIPVTIVPTTVGAAPIVVDLGPPLDGQGAILAGAPDLDTTVGSLILGVADVFLFTGIGIQRAATPGVWELIDGQAYPTRGVAKFKEPAYAVAERFAPGDSIGLMFYGNSQTFSASTTRDDFPLEVQGRIRLPLFPPTQRGSRSLTAADMSSAASGAAAAAAAPGDVRVSPAVLGVAGVGVLAAGALLGALIVRAKGRDRLAFERSKASMQHQQV